MLKWIDKKKMLSWLLLFPLHAKLACWSDELVAASRHSRSLAQSVKEERQRLQAASAAYQAASKERAVLEHALMNFDRGSDTAVFRGEVRARLLRLLCEKLGPGAECPIMCVPMMDDPVVLCCGHVLHRSAWDRYRLVDPLDRCPMCRREGAYALNEAKGAWEII